MPTRLNGQVIGRAEHATRAVLDRLLAGTDTTFHQWVALNLTAANGGAIDRDQLAARLTDGLKVDASAAIAELLSTGLLARSGAGDSGGPPGAVELTDAGRARHDAIRAAIDAVTARLYGDLPTDDLETAGRVLAVVTARANAELSA